MPWAHRTALPERGVRRSARSGPLASSPRAAAPFHTHLKVSPSLQCLRGISFWTRLLLFLREHRSTGTWIVPTVSSPRISGSGTCIDRRRVPRDFRAGAGRPATRWRSRSQVDLFGRRPHNATCRVLDFDQNPNVVYLHPASKATPKVEGLSPSTDQELPERAAGRILTGRARRMSSCLTT